MEAHDPVEELYKRLALELDPGNPITGLRAQKIITEELGGLRVTIPSVKELHRRARNKKIREKFDGANIEELALTFNLAPSQIRRILKEERVCSIAPPSS